MATDASGNNNAASKGAYSYAYFATSVTAPVAVAPPRKLTEAEVAAQQELEQQRNAAGSSAWNAAGTFEERSWTEWAKDRLSSLLNGERVSGAGDTCVTVTAVTIDKGHANAWIVRGKKRHGFDFELTVSWSATVGGKEAKGTVKIPNAASDELDELSLSGCELTAGGKPGGALDATAIKTAEKLLPELLVAKLEQLYSELKQK